MAKQIERQCIVTRQVKPDVEMIRFVVGPARQLVPDITGRLPGRGIWVSAARLNVAEAVAKRLFSKSAKQPVTIPDDLMTQIETLLRRRMVEALHLARKAGQLLSGHDRVAEALAKGQVALLLHAADASMDGVRKLKAGEVPDYKGFSRDELSEITGRENSVHVAVLEGPAGAFFIAQLRRFALFMEETGL
jgi:uncharacterized protein